AARRTGRTRAAAAPAARARAASAASSYLLPRGTAGFFTTPATGLTTSAIGVLQKSHFGPSWRCSTVRTSLRWDAQRGHSYSYRGIRAASEAVVEQASVDLDRALR